MKTININGITFEIKKDQPQKFNSTDTIFKLYKKPSETKINIYYDRKEKLHNITALTWNSQLFTIYWQIKDNNNWNVYKVKIAPSHNFIY